MFRRLLLQTILGVCIAHPARAELRNGFVSVQGAKLFYQDSGGSGVAVVFLVALLDHLGIDRAHLVGTAAGGLIAFDFAQPYPRRLRSLVVADSIASTGGVDAEIAAMRSRLTFPHSEEIPAQLLELGPTHRAADPEGMKRWMTYHQRSRQAGPRPPSQTYQNKLTLQMFEKIQAPPLQALGATHIRAARTVVVLDAGHSTFWEQPDVFNKEVLQFLTQH